MRRGYAESTDASPEPYGRLIARAIKAPKGWEAPCVHAECTLHQLSPYIGKLKSAIARDLIKEYSTCGDLVVDPFAGSGTVPLEAVLNGRPAFAADISPYAAVLCEGKLSAPPSLPEALAWAEQALEDAEGEPPVDLRRVPMWVRSFFHPDTLREAIRFASLCMRRRYMFLMACFLGILHHQRPGFLSYPSSHLVPYLRDKKYPRERYPRMYEYRELRSRLLAKVRRAYGRPPRNAVRPASTFRLSGIDEVELPAQIDCVVTSPPYMNTLDYTRDNRLRLWFVSPSGKPLVDDTATREKQAFEEAIGHLATAVEQRLRRRGNCVVIVGEGVTRSYAGHPSQVVHRVFTERARSLRLTTVIRDHIPDVRRSRRHCSGAKTEHVLVFRRA